MSIKLAHPLPGSTPTDGFGWRESIPSIGLPAQLHNGQDYAAPAGTPIRAAHDGIVRWSGWDVIGGGWGVQLQHDDGWSTLYLHMRERSTDATIGQRVKTGQVIGRVGATGMATGNHTHFMLRVGGKDIDPVPYIDIDIKAELAQLVRRNKVFIIKLKNGRWYLVVPNGNGKMRAVWLPAKSGASASNIDVLDYKHATNEQLKSLREAVDGI